MIELKDIVVKFGDFEALHNINVNVKEGEFFTFLGPSGCGKTTTLRTITGFIEPVSGTVNVDGKDITHVPIEKRNIGIVFQSYALFPTMTVYDNIAFGLKIKKLKKDEIDRKVRDIARKVDLSDEQLKKAVGQLSGGQQQRVAIARALVTGPAIICMDEPLSNLDAKLRVQLRNELKKMQREFGITTIYVTHDQTEAMTLGDRIVIMKDGVIQQIGTPQEVFNHPVNLFVAGFIGVPQMNFYDAELKRDEDGVYSVLMDGIRVVPTVEKQERLRQASVPPQEIILGVRPEHIMLLENGEHGVHGKVEVSEMMGSAVHLHVDINGRDSIIVAQTSGMDGAQYIPPESGTSISFIFGGNVVHLFSKKDGHNLEF